MNSSVRSDRPGPAATNGMPFAGVNGHFFGREIGPSPHWAHRSIPGQRGPLRHPVGRDCGTPGRKGGGLFPAQRRAKDGHRFKDRVNRLGLDLTAGPENFVAMDLGDPIFVVPGARSVLGVFRPGTVSVALKTPRRGGSVLQDLPRGETVRPSPLLFIARVAARFSIPLPWGDLFALRVVPSENRSLRRLPFRFLLWLPR